MYNFERTIPTYCGFNWLNGFREFFEIIICKNQPNLYIFGKNQQNLLFQQLPVTYVIPFNKMELHLKF